MLKVVEQARSDILANYKDMGLRASGEFEKGLNIVQEQGRIRLMAVAHSWYMENGRRSGGRPPRDVILKWIRDKGIQPQGISEKQLAYLIARKIGRDGIKVPNKYNPGGVISSVITPQLKEKIIESLKGEMADIILNSVKNDSRN